MKKINYLNILIFSFLAVFILYTFIIANEDEEKIEKRVNYTEIDITEIAELPPVTFYTEFHYKALPNSHKFSCDPNRQH